MKEIEERKEQKKNFNGREKKKLWKKKDSELQKEKFY